MLDRKPVIYIELDTQGKDDFFFSGQALNTNKTKLSGFPTGGIGEKRRQDVDFPAPSRVFVVLFLARTCFLFLLERKEGVKYVE